MSPRTRNVPRVNARSLRVYWMSTNWRSSASRSTRVAHLEPDHAVDVLLRRAQAVDARHRGDDDHVAPGQQAVGRGVPQPLDLVVDRGVLLDVGVRLRDVGLGLVVVVVGDEVLDRVVGQQLAELVGQLGGQGLVRAPSPASAAAAARPARPSWPTCRCRWRRAARRRCSPARIRRSSSSIAAGWSPAGWKSLTTRTGRPCAGGRWSVSRAPPYVGPSRQLRARLARPPSSAHSRSTCGPQRRQRRRSLSSTTSAAARRSSRVAWAAIRARASSAIPRRRPAGAARTSSGRRPRPPRRSRPARPSRPAAVRRRRRPRPAAAPAISSALRRRRAGGRSPSSAASRSGSANTTRPSAARSSEPSAASTSRPELATTAASPASRLDGLAGQRVGVDDDGAVRREQPATSDLPDPMPPVSPTVITTHRSGRDPREIQVVPASSGPARRPAPERGRTRATATCSSPERGRSSSRSGPWVRSASTCTVYRVRVIEPARPPAAVARAPRPVSSRHRPSTRARCPRCRPGRAWRRCAAPRPGASAGRAVGVTPNSPPVQGSVPPQARLRGPRRQRGARHQRSSSRADSAGHRQPAPPRRPPARRRPDSPQRQAPDGQPDEEVRGPGQHRVDAGDRASSTGSPGRPARRSRNGSTRRAQQVADQRRGHRPDDGRVASTPQRQAEQRDGHEEEQRVVRRITSGGESTVPSARPRASSRAPARPRHPHPRERAGRAGRAAAQADPGEHREQGRRPAGRDEVGRMQAAVRGLLREDVGRRHAEQREPTRDVDPDDPLHVDRARAPHQVSVGTHWSVPGDHRQLARLIPTSA